MKLLRIVLLLGGLFLIGWGIYSWIQGQTDQVLAKAILGLLVILASNFARSRRP